MRRGNKMFKSRTPKTKTEEAKRQRTESNKDIDIELARRIQAGDHTAFIALVNKYRPFAFKEARRWHLTTHVDLDDLNQQAMLGIMHAAKKFDPDRDLAFLTYASDWVYAFIERYIENCWRTIRVPTYAYKRYRAMLKNGEVDSAQGVDLSIVLALSQSPIPIDSLIEDVEGGTGILREIPDPRYGTSIGAADKVIDMIGMRNMVALLEETLETLPERLRLVLQIRFYEDKTLEETADLLFKRGKTKTRLSRERMRQNEVEGIGMLRKMMLLRLNEND